MSLRSQVEEGKARGFSDEEIGWGLKKSVVSGSPLRIYLDSKPDLPLTRVMEMISGSYREKSSSDLFQELNMLSQDKSEDAHQFLLRALGLRQKVLTTAEAEGETFDAKLVNNAFLHALRTGIMEESIRNHLKPFLDKASFAPDHVLLAEVNNAMAEDAARTRKLEANR